MAKLSDERQTEILNRLAEIARELDRDIALLDEMASTALKEERRVVGRRVRRLTDELWLLIEEGRYIKWDLLSNASGLTKREIYQGLNDS